MTNTPHKCPVCEGRGIVPCDFYTGPTYGVSMDPVECRSCTGKGYVVLNDASEPVKVVERGPIGLRLEHPIHGAIYGISGDRENWRIVSYNGNVYEGNLA